ncbi:MAG: hypothetical protein R2857_03975 [Vampirovibrionales bacterium]
MPYNRNEGAPKTRPERSPTDAAHATFTPSPQCSGKPKHLPRPSFGKLTVYINPHSAQLDSVQLRDDQDARVEVAPSRFAWFKRQHPALKGVFKRPWWPFGKNKAAGVEVGRAHLLNLPVFGPTGFLIQGFEGLLNHWDAILDGQFDPSPTYPPKYWLPDTSPTWIR